MASTRVLAVVLLLAAPAAWAGPGTSGAQWLAVGAGARAQAMGGAGVALADDGTALWWNPAGLAGSDAHRFTLSHASWLSGASYQHIGYAGRLGASSAVGGALEKGGLSWDNTGEGDFTADDFLGSVGYARTISDRLALGAALKLVSSALGDDRATSYAVDAGVLFEPLEGVRVGGAVRNVGPGLDFGGGADPLPVTAAVGASYAWRDVVLALDVEKQNDLDAGARLGVEYRPVRPLALRGGAVLEGESALSAVTAGVGLSWNDRWSLDYAYRPSDLSAAHHFAVSTALGGGAVALSGASEPAPAVVGAPESNISVLTKLTREVVREALGKMTVPPRSDVYLREVEKHDASWLVQSVLLEELTAAGHAVKSGGFAAGGEEPGVYEIAYRIVACQTSVPRVWREWVVGPRKVERKTDVDIHFQLSDSSKDVVWAGNASRTRREVIPGSLFDDLETPGAAFTCPEIEAGGWDRVLEPVIVAGIVGGLIYLFYTSRTSG